MTAFPDPSMPPGEVPPLGDPGAPPEQPVLPPSPDEPPPPSRDEPSY